MLHVSAVFDGAFSSVRMIKFGRWSVICGNKLPDVTSDSIVFIKIWSIKDGVE